MSDVDHFGSWLQRERTAKGITRQQLADASGVTPQQIHNIETGKTARPRDRTRRKLVDAIKAFPTTESGTTAMSDEGARTPDRTLEIGEEIGSGAFGTVYRGFDRVLERPVAIKFVRESGDAVLTAVGQARILARANHLNVIAVYRVAPVVDPETSTVRDAIVMELADGPKLEDRLAGPPLDVPALRTICLGIVDAMAHIHAREMVHQDLHEGNVILVGTTPKVIDPMHLTNFDKLQPEAVKRRIEADLTNLHTLLRTLVAHSEVSEVRRVAFCAGPIKPLNIENIRRELVAVLDVPPTSLQVPDRVASPAAERVQSRSRLGRTLIVSFAVVLIAVVALATIFKLRPSERGELPQSSRATSQVAIAASPYTTFGPRDSAAVPNASSLSIAASAASNSGLPLQTKPASCSLPDFSYGAAQRFVAASDTEVGAKFIKIQLGKLLKTQPNGEVWTTALQYYGKPLGKRMRWVVVVHSMTPATAASFCRWLVECQAWSQFCSANL